MAKLAINGGPKAAEKLEVPQWPMLDDEDKEAILEALESRRWCRIYPGSRVEEFEKAFAEYHGAKYSVAVSNGTVALELALLACGIEPGDEVLVTAISFIASASAIVTSVGAVPVFVDIEPETASISPEGIEEAITDRTKGVVVVHYGGYPVDFDRILPIVEKHDLVLIEDCAHAQGTEWKGRKVGTFGDMGAFSFQESKAFTAGEGGIVLTDDEGIAERARLLHNIGRVVGRPGYEHHVLASNYRMLELQAALLLAQLRRYQRDQVRVKHENGEFLAQGLKEIGGVEPLRRDERITQRGYYLFVIRYDSEQFGGVHRDRFVEALRAEGVPCGAGYGMPLYKQPAFERERIEPLLPESSKPWPDYENMYLPVAEHFCAEEQITLPHQVLLADRSGLQAILDAVAKVKENADEIAAEG
ncbi:MAG: DegT/DnrJ/EryC1/StrS family aminotransferase [Chloroflexota bacterium]|nr:DegT/DnrJ/EryC1/StrS family aminotransferase [Chloroflexota bacterium]